MVQLVPMTDADLQAFLAQAIDDYANEHIRGGRWTPDEAYAESAREFAELLPDGVQSPDQFLYMIHADSVDEPVGVLWFARRTRGGKGSAFIYEVQVFPQFQRRGYAQQAFEALEPLARSLGLESISLHVFGHNHAARALYEKLGFSPTNIMMNKPLGDGPA